MGRTEPRPPGSARTALSRVWPLLGRLAGLLAGSLGGIYGAAAGFLLGTMIDEARRDRRLKSYFRDAGRPLEPGSLAGLAPAAGIAILGDWGVAAALASRAELFETMARIHARRDGLPANSALLAALASLPRREALPAPLKGLMVAAGRWLQRRRHEAWLGAVLTAVLASERPDRDGLARSLAADAGAGAARRLLADYAWNLALRQAGSLDHARAEDIRTRLIDAGLDGATIERSRQACFPTYRDPWEILGIGREADLATIKEAWLHGSADLIPGMDLPRGKDSPESPYGPTGDPYGITSRQARQGAHADKHGDVPAGADDAAARHIAGAATRESNNILLEETITAEMLEASSEENRGLLTRFLELREAYAFLYLRYRAMHGEEGAGVR